jgi:hypothetical protein
MIIDYSSCTVAPKTRLLVCLLLLPPMFEVSIIEIQYVLMM